ncbi:hypothetical protein N431DRAFT_456771 [Stipitochalara longipes BDJ]|nr:hypothetical protein N431DRAFT_456771 [Stipitochalara longipes BDJ]
MAPPLYLNATCVTEETLGFAYIDTTTFNETTCAIANPFFEGKWWIPRRILSIIILFLLVIVFVWRVTASYIYCSTIKRVRMLPTARVHETIEAWTEAMLTGRNWRKFEKYEKGRYKSVTEIVDNTAKTRTVTIVEDLKKKPLKRKERYDMPKVPKGWASAQDLGPYMPPAGNAAAAPAAAPGAMATDVPLERVGPGAQIAAQDQAQASGSAEGTAEIDIGASQPPYKHHWSNFI